jgi:hypothetical protein
MGFFKPLGIFCTQSESQKYIKSVRNLGDAWRTLSEKPAHLDTAFVETTFDLVLKAKTSATDKPCVSFEIPSFEATTDKPSIAPELQRHYRIFADYGTDFLWRNTNDPDYSEDNTYVEAEEALSDLPPAVFQYYDAWVDTYTSNFKTRCNIPGDYSAPVFVDATDEVSWNIAGYLLAWRIAMAPHIGSVEYSAGNEKYLLKSGEGTEGALMEKFLNDQATLLVKRESIE